ncbi:MAG TPA: hypothetical protein VIH58_11455 [Chthoniobacterales bacterium]
MSGSSTVHFRECRALLTSCLCTVSLYPACGQESIRPSLAGDSVAALTRPIIDNADYNLELGPALVSLSSTLQFAFNDNIELSEIHRESDLIVTPTIDASALWQVTELNALRLDLGIGYSKYLNHSQFDTETLLIAPNSDISFDIYIGDFRITLSDQFSIQQNPVDEITLSRVGKFERFQNSAGLSVIWDLNAFTLVAGYTNYLFRSFDSEFGFLDRTEQQFYSSAGFRLNDAMTVGLRATGAVITYVQNFQNSGVIYNFGPFIETHLTQYTRLSLEAGYQGGAFEVGGLNGDKSSLSGFYGRLLLRHRLNDYWTESLAIGREAQTGLTTNFTTINYVRYAADWRINSRITLNLAAFYEHGVDSPGLFESERINRIGFSAGFGYKIAKHAVVSIGYQYINRASDLAGLSYRQNLVLWTMSYAF